MTFHAQHMNITLRQKRSEIMQVQLTQCFFCNENAQPPTATQTRSWNICAPSLAHLSCATCLRMSLPSLQDVKKNNVQPFIRHAFAILKIIMCRCSCPPTDFSQGPPANHCTSCCPPICVSDPMAPLAFTKSHVHCRWVTGVC